MIYRTLRSTGEKVSANRGWGGVVSEVPMPATAAAFQMNVAEFSESKEEDFSALITLMERVAGWKHQMPGIAELRVQGPVRVQAFSSGLS